jgi:hypothetical protein
MDCDDPCAVFCCAGAYQLALAEPKVMGGETHHTGMWVKLQLGWQHDAPRGATEHATEVASQALPTSTSAATHV